MRLSALAIVVLLIGWLATGCFVVRGDEQVLVRRFGRLQPGVRSGGWHVDLPWPFTRIDRVKVHEVRTLTIGVPASVTAGDLDPLVALFRDRQAEFLTGDKNIINVQVQVQYTIADPTQFLLTSSAPEIALQVLAESLVTDAVSRRGVDEIQPLGLTELRELLLRTIREGVTQQNWGISIDDVAIGGVFPPVEVKEAFLDVSNARAEKERGIQEEQMQSEKRLAQARASANERLDRAASDKNRRTTAARGEADRFVRLVGQMQQEATTASMPYAQVRRLTVQRMVSTMLEELLPKLAGKVLLDGQQPADVTIFPQKGNEPPVKIPAETMPSRKN